MSILKHFFFNLNRYPENPNLIPRKTDWNLILKNKKRISYKIYENFSITNILCMRQNRARFLFLSCNKLYGST